MSSNLLGFIALGVGAAQGVQATSGVEYACVATNTTDLPFCDPSLSFDDRVKDLVSRLTLDEKLGLMSSTHAAVPRLGIPGYAWGNECLHGTVVRSNDEPSSVPQTGATVFPQPIGLAATFDTDLMAGIGQAIGDESRGLSNSGATTSGVPAFLDCWAPNINIFRFVAMITGHC